MNDRTHFRNQTGSVFSRLECQLACALVLYVRTRRHPRSMFADHSQPPTLQMLNGILREIRWTIWDAARRRDARCNPMRPDARLDAYCLMRNLRMSLPHQGWYNEVRNNPEVWSHRAYDMFEDWIYANSRLVREYVFLFPPRFVEEAMTANS